MAVPAGSHSVTYNFAVSNLLGPVASPEPVTLSLIDLSGGLSVQDMSDIIQVGMNAVLADLKTRYPAPINTVTASRYYGANVTGDPWPTP